MERSASRRKSDRLLYELEDCLSLMERKHGLCASSIMESSNVGFSTRDDCSFEYSELGDISLDNSQSLMDETNGPLLLALVEDYILGQRLQMMTTGESEDDEVSPTSSFESETCFSHENSEVLQQISGIESFFSNNSDHGSPCDDIEIPESTMHQDSNSKSRFLDKSRWQALLLSLSNSRNNLTKNPNRYTANYDSRVNVDLVPTNQANSSLSKRDSNGESTPSVLYRSWDRLKAVNPLKRSVLPNARNVHPLFSPSESSKVRNDQESLINSLVSSEKDVLKSSSMFNKSTGKKEILPIFTMAKKEKSFPPNASPKETIPIDEADRRKIKQAEPTEEIIQIFDENLDNVPINGENVENEPRKANSTDDDERVVVLGDTLYDNELMESIKNDKALPVVALSGFNESIEEPNNPSIEVEQKQLKTVFSPTTGKIRLPLPKRFSGHYSQICQTLTDTPIGSENDFDKHVKSHTHIQKSILCSHCRCKLSEQSVCAAMASESFDGDVRNEQDAVEPEILQICDTIMEEDIAASHESLTSENNDECIEMKRSMAFEVLQPHAAKTQQNVVDDLPVSSNVMCNRTQEVKHTQPEENCVNNKIAATICSPLRKTETPTIHIEFKDWQGNEVEIVQESPQKKANRLFWKHGLFPNKESATTNSPHCMQQQDSGKNNGDIISSSNNIAEKTREESAGNIQCDTVDHVDIVTLCPVTAIPKKVLKKKFFGMINKRTRLKMPKNSDCMKEEGSIYHGAVEQSFNEEANPFSVTTNVVDELLFNKKDVPAPENRDKLNETKSFTPNVGKEAAICENEEALLLEQAMKEIHTDARYDNEGSKTRSFLRSPVTLYRFLDYNPCRNELVHENSYDTFADPVGLSVAELFAQKACFAKQYDDKEVNYGETQKSAETGQVPEIDGTQLLKPPHPSSNSSLKKVFRRLSKKVAFRDNLIETSPRDKHAAKVVRAASTMRKQNAVEDSKLDNANFILATGALPTIRPDTNLSELQGKNNGTADEKKIPEDILKKLLKEASKTKISLAQDDVTTKKTKRAGRKINCSSPKAVKKASTKKNRSPKANRKKSAKSQAHAEQVAQLLSELKKVKAASKSQGGKISESIDEQSPTDRVSDGATIGTLGTKQSYTSSLSRLTTEEQKVARRMINDIQLLAKIEKKRRSIGNKKSSLKNSDMDRTLKLLLAIETSRRSRIPSSTKDGKEVLISTEKPTEDSFSSETRETNPMKNMVSVFGGLSFFSDTKSKKENN
jgi:hypothetical protein